MRLAPDKPASLIPLAAGLPAATAYWELTLLSVGQVVVHLVTLTVSHPRYLLDLTDLTP
jgi:hypothetical protein